MSKQIKARFNKKYVQENTFHNYRKMVNEVMCENPLPNGNTYNPTTETCTFDADQFKQRLNQILTVKRELDWFVAYNWQREKEYYPNKQHNYGSVDDLMSIRSTLDYISDRWNCFMRAAWLVEVLDNYLAGMFDGAHGVAEYGYSYETHSYHLLQDSKECAETVVV
jgi:hypothetical protein